MPASSHSHSRKRDALSALRALFTLSFGWLLLLGLAHTIEPAAGRLTPERVHVKAELRVGEQAPAPVADVGVAQASLRALHARVRSAPSPLLTSPAWFAAVALPPRRCAQTDPYAASQAERAPKRTQLRHWPLPRSACHADDGDPAAPRA